MGEYWMVQFYNELDAGFGYDPGPGTYMIGLEPCIAKSIARMSFLFVRPEICP